MLLRIPLLHHAVGHDPQNPELLLHAPAPTLRNASKNLVTQLRSIVVTSASPANETLHLQSEDQRQTKLNAARRDSADVYAKTAAWGKWLSAVDRLPDKASDATQQREES